MLYTSPPSHNKPSIEQMPSIIAFIRKGWKIEAIKAFRTYYGPCGLKEAKDAIECIEKVIRPLTESAAPKKYIVLDRNTEFGDFDLTRCRDKAEATQLANNLVTDSLDVIVATVVCQSERVTTLVLKDVA